MTATQIHEALDAMLANPKSKNFLGHLIKNYFPVTNVYKVLERPEGPFKCVLTKDNLVSTMEVATGLLTDEYSEEFNEYMLSSLDEGFNGKHPVLKVLNGRKIGYTGKETTTYMSYEALQEFYNWVMTKSLNGDKHINWVLGSVRGNFYGKPEKPVVEKKTMVSTYSLGETDAFKKLMEKFKDEN